jgi:hypothetical protein
MPASTCDNFRISECVNEIPINANCLQSRVFGKFPTGGDGEGNLPITPFQELRFESWKPLLSLIDGGKPLVSGGKV